MRTRVISVRLGVEKVDLLDELATRNHLNRNQMISLLVDSAIRMARESDEKGNLIGMHRIERTD